MNRPASLLFEANVSQEVVKAYVEAPSGAEHEAVIQELNKGMLHVYSLMFCDISVT